MSRSYHKHFVFDSEYGPMRKSRGKKFAARKVRRSKDVGQNGSYKKLYESWNFESPWHYCYDGEEHFVEVNRGYGKSDEELRHIWRKNFLKNIIDF